jgi:prepilin-type N-terminal cleavage/methylation domain-containing protein
MKRPIARRISKVAIRRDGFTLVELVAVMALMTLILMMSGVAIATLLKIGRTGAAGMQRLLAQKELADQFRADVARAVAAPAEFGKYKAGKECILLRNTNDDFVAYRWLGGTLERSLLSQSRPERWPIPVGSSVVAGEFDRSGIDRGIVTLRLIDSRARRGQVMEISAALGGDLR